MRRACALLLPALLAASLAEARERAGTARSETAAAPGDAPRPYTPAPTHAGYERRSLLVPMRDGVRLAVDVWLPADRAPGERLPAILHQTRYWRRAHLRWPASWLVDPFAGRLGAFRRRFLAHGYAWVDVDTRGSGASFGVRPWDFSPDEIQDGADLVAWIVAQPWSNGLVGGAGASYAGTAAEFLLVSGHPAVRAVAPLLCEYDQYAHILAPGGVPHEGWYETWGRTTRLLDRGVFPLPGWRARFVRGVAPVDADRDGALLAAALGDHAGNYDFRKLAGVTFRDDLPFAPGDGSTPAARAAVARGFAWLERRFGPGFRTHGVGLASTHTYEDELRRAHAAVYAVSGWLDGDYAAAAIERFRARRRPGDKLLIGPWDHTLGDVSPADAPPEPAFDLAGELLKFFDHHLKGIATGIDHEPPVHVFAFGAQRWHAAATWPPPGVRWEAVYLAGGGALRDAPPGDAEASDVFALDLDARAGRATRWDTLPGIALPPLGTPDPRASAPAMAWESEPLPRPLALAGAPRIFLHLDASAPDLALFATLLDVAPGGAALPVADGRLRALHRALAAPPEPGEPLPRSYRRADAAPLVPGTVAELVFDLEPVSYQVAAGHRLRLALAGADRDHFARIPAAGPVALRVHRDRMRRSRIELPVSSR